AGPLVASLPTARAAETRLRLPGVVQVSFSGFEDTAERARFFGDVDMEVQDARVLADEIVYDKSSRVVEARGNVVLSFQGAVLSGTRLEYRTVDDTGTIENVVGYLEQDEAILRAQRIERIGPRRLRVHHGVFTTCTQPTPYWSFRISRGTFDLGQYAYLRGVGFRAGRVPLFYTPYLIWPIKTDRASGLLFPEFHSSDKLGQTLSLPVYWAFADSADVTFLIDYHSRVGPALGADLVWLPTWNGHARGAAYWINDQVRRETRYRLDWEQRQDLPHEIRLTADIEEISDFDYTIDYETDLERAAIPQTRSTIDLTRHWSWYSLSLRAARYEQFFVSQTAFEPRLDSQVVNQQLPELELRGRSQRLGRSPIYFSFQSSVAGFQKKRLALPEGFIGRADEDDLVVEADDGWFRVDFAPQFQLPIVRTASLDMQLEAGWRGTWYSARDTDPTSSQQIVSESLMRSLWNAGLSIAGPRLQRIYQTPKWQFSPKLKHVIEPFVSYSWRPESDIDATEVIVSDEIDNIPGELSDLFYGIRQRLFVLRPAASDKPMNLATARESSFDALEEAAAQARQRELASADEPALEDAIEISESLNPTEILSFELSQRHSFVRPLSTLYDPSGSVAGERDYSPLTARLRFHPTHQNSVDVSYVFDAANGKLTESSVSTMMMFPRGAFFRGSWFKRNPANPALLNASSFLRSTWGVAAGRRFRFEASIDYDIEAGQLDHQAYQLTYNTQCCSFRLGYDQRDFVDNSRQEWLLVISLQGIGEVLDLKKSE
ncbi:MAG: LPS-assembly protein LptD, partial [Acidobacteriota bacterium]